MDTIFIKDLLIRGVIGVYEWEREVTQDIIVNAELTVDTRLAGESDDMNDSVNYNDVCNRIIQIVEVTSPYLIERLINQVAKTILEEFSLDKIRLTIEKPGALRFSKSVGITIERTLADYA